MTVKRLALAALAATALLALTTGSASALRSLSISEPRITALGAAITFEQEGFALDICEIAFTLELPRVAMKSPGTRMGTATSLRVVEEEARGEHEHCRPFRIRIVSRPPYSVIYLGFQGVLPQITRVELEILGVDMLVAEAEGLAHCDYRMNLSMKAGSNRPTLVTEFSEVAARERILFRQLGPVEICASWEEVSLKGSFAITRPTEGTRLSLI